MAANRRLLGIRLEAIGKDFREVRMSELLWQALLVTFGQKQGDHEFDEGITTTEGVVRTKELSALGRL